MSSMTYIALIKTSLYNLQRGMSPVSNLSPVPCPITGEILVCVRKHLIPRTWMYSNWADLRRNAKAYSTLVLKERYSSFGNSMVKRVKGQEIAITSIAEETRDIGQDSSQVPAEGFSTLEQKPSLAKYSPHKTFTMLTRKADERH